jgi:hypothetical protein
MSKIKLFEEFFNESRPNAGGAVSSEQYQSQIDTLSKDDGLDELRDMLDKAGKKNEANVTEGIIRFEDFGNNTVATEDCVGHHGEDEEDPDMIEPEEDEPENQLEEDKADPSEVTSKDTMRIKDIVRKSNGDENKQLSLARQMANSITDQWKAMRREYAAIQENLPRIARIFRQRAVELGAHGA